MPLTQFEIPFHADSPLIVRVESPSVGDGVLPTARKVQFVAHLEEGETDTQFLKRICFQISTKLKG